MTIENAGAFLMKAFHDPFAVVIYIKVGVPHGSIVGKILEDRNFVLFPLVTALRVALPAAAIDPPDAITVEIIIHHSVVKTCKTVRVFHVGAFRIVVDFTHSAPPAVRVGAFDFL